MDKDTKEFCGSMELDIDVKCDISDPENPKIISAELFGIDILDSLKRKEKRWLELQCEEVINDELFLAKKNKS